MYPGSGKQNPTYLLLLEVWLSAIASINVTTVTESGVGALRNQETFGYDGCIGSVQRNDSDFALIGVKLDYYGPTAMPAYTLTHDQPVIASIYHKSNSSAGSSCTSTRVLDFLDAYSPALWFVTVYITLFILAMTSAAMILRRESFGLDCRMARRLVTNVLACFLHQHSSCCTRRLRSIPAFLLLLLAILGFYTTFFLLSMISTEMVVIPRPETYNSYRDLLDHDVLPIWVEGMNDQRFFQHAVPDSYAHRLWIRAVERGLTHSLAPLSRDTMSFVQRTQQPLFDRRAAFISNRLTTEAVVENVCAFTRSNNLLPNSGAYVHVDDGEASEILRVALISTSADESLKKIATRAGNRIMAGGILAQQVMFLAHNFLPDRSHAAEVAECAAGRIVMPDNEFHPVNLPHYSDLLTLAAVLVLVSSFVLVIELGRANRHRMASVSPLVK